MPYPYLIECKTTPLHEYQCSLRILIRFNPALLIPTIYNAFHLTNLLVFFPRNRVPNNNVASFSCKENWHNPKFLPIYHFTPLAHAAPQFLKELTPLYSNNSTCVEVIIGTVFKSCDKHSLSISASFLS